MASMVHDPWSTVLPTYQVPMPTPSILPLLSIYRSSFMLLLPLLIASTIHDPSTTNALHPSTSSIYRRYTIHDPIFNPIRSDPILSYPILSKRAHSSLHHHGRPRRHRPCQCLSPTTDEKTKLIFTHSSDSELQITTSDSKRNSARSS